MSALLEPTPLVQTGPTAPDPRYSVETFGGRFVDLSNPLPEQFDLEDVAAGLSKVCRYAAGPKWFYCVAEHAWWVSKRLELLGFSVRKQLGGLHHDDAEFVMGDVTTPMKRYLADREAAMLDSIQQSQGALLTVLLAPHIDDWDTITSIVSQLDDNLDTYRESILKELEASLMAAIIPGLGFASNELDLTDPAIKSADLWALAGEARYLTKSRGEGWLEIGEYDARPDLSSLGLSSERAKALWLERHHELTAQLRQPPTPGRHV